ncbi:MAG: hypothetical protein H7Z19_15410 [Chitinophagaceae bacterium]|nr:hypothetical protein [Rubrivivax sp.]
MAFTLRRYGVANLPVAVAAAVGGIDSTWDALCTGRVLLSRTRRTPQMPGATAAPATARTNRLRINMVDPGYGNPTLAPRV